MRPRAETEAGILPAQNTRPSRQIVNDDLPEGACDQQQSGDVFFLAGNMGGASKRTCTVPAGKAIFFPIVNLTVMACPEVANAEYPHKR